MCATNDGYPTPSISMMHTCRDAHTRASRLLKQSVAIHKISSSSHSKILENWINFESWLASSRLGCWTAGARFQCILVGKYLETSDQGFRRDFHRLTLDLYKKKPFPPHRLGKHMNTPINLTPGIETAF